MFYAPATAYTQRDAISFGRELCGCLSDETSIYRWSVKDYLRAIIDPIGIWVITESLLYRINCPVNVLLSHARDL